MTFRDVVVVIPGIGGSILSKDGRPIWGPTPGALSAAFLNGSLDQLAMAGESLDEDMGDGIKVSGVMPDVQIIPGLWKIDGYAGLVETLCGSLDLVERRNLVTFAYDWRRDNRVSARRLKTVAEATLENWRRESGAADAKLVIVAHSMGGLVARHFIECLEGWRTTRRLVSIATPYRGSLNALGFLANGYAKRIGPFSADATKALRSFASVHQLLPTYDCILDSGTVKRVDQVTIAGLDRLKVADAVAFHDGIGGAVKSNASVSGYDGRYVSAVLSRSQPTMQSASIVNGGVELIPMRGGNDEGGDGTVPMISGIVQGLALTDGFFAAGLHASLQNVGAVREHVLAHLKGLRIDLSRLRSGNDDAGIRFGLEDAYDSDQSVELRAEVQGVREQKLLAEAVETQTGKVVEGVLFPGDGGYRGSLALAPGAWRITLRGDVVAPVSDVTLVASRSGCSADMI